MILILLLWFNFTQATELGAIELGGRSYAVEVASTPKDHEKGLMNRARIDKGIGMLFVYPDSKKRAFWMKDTPLQLSIGFFDGKGTLLEIQHMNPDGGRTRYVSKHPVRYALEVEKGWYEKNGIDLGAQLKLKN